MRAKPEPRFACIHTMKTCSAQCKRHRMQPWSRRQAARGTRHATLRHNAGRPLPTSESRRSRGGEACWASAGGQAASSACAAGGATRLGRPRSTSLRLRCPERHGSWGTSGSGVLRSTSTLSHAVESKAETVGATHEATSMPGGSTKLVRTSEAERAQCAEARRCPR